MRAGTPRDAQRLGPAPVWCTRFQEQRLIRKEEDPEPQEAWLPGATRPRPEAVLGGDGGQSGQRLVSLSAWDGLSHEGTAQQGSTGPPSLRAGDTLSGGPTGCLGRPPPAPCPGVRGAGRARENTDLPAGQGPEVSWKLL